MQNPVWGSNSWTVRSWPEPRSRVGRLTDWATQVPQSLFLFLSNLYTQHGVQTHNPQIESCIFYQLSQPGDSQVIILFYFILFLKVYLFILRHRERTSREGAEREGISSRLCTVISVEPNVGLELTNCEVMFWAEIKSQMLNQLSHPGAPQVISLNNCHGL